MKRKVGILTVLAVAAMAVAGFFIFATATTDATATSGFQRLVHLAPGDGCDECPTIPGCALDFCTDSVDPNGAGISRTVCVYNCFGLQ